jgi:hypothetical protein
VYDTDFCYSAYLAGFRIAVCKDILIAHQSRGNFGEQFAAYGARFKEKYGTTHRPGQQWSQGSGGEGSRSDADAATLQQGYRRSACVIAIMRV